MRKLFLPALILAFLVALVASAGCGSRTYGRGGGYYGPVDRHTGAYCDRRHYRVHRGFVRGCAYCGHLARWH